MQAYLFLVGVCSVAYYSIIAGYTRKWDSTFAGFWVFCGVLHFVLAVIYPKLPEAGRYMLGGVLFLCWLLFLLVEWRILCAMRPDFDKDVKYLIVLGAQVRGVRITNSLMRRLDSAYLYLNRHPDTIVVVSGGQGKGEAISEADAMASNLEARGIVPERIIREARSTSTRENLQFSAELIGDMTQPIALVTNNFHVYRSLLIGRQVGYTNLEGIAATSNPVLLVNYMVREFFAVLLTKMKAML